MARRFSSRSQPLRQISQRRRTAWDAGPLATGGGQTIAAAGKTVWGTGKILALDSNVTLTRIRGMYTMWLDLVTAAGDGLFGAIGIGIVSSDAFGVGSSAMPGPFTDPAWPGWMWHQFFHIRGVAVQSQGADVARNVSADFRIDIDSKAQRIFKINETFFGMTEVGSETGTAGAIFQANTRTLIKLP